MKPYYNYEFKEYFLKGSVIPLVTKRKEQYESLFRKTHDFELKLNKDLYDFTFSELDTLLKNLSMKTYAVSSRYISLINSYVQACIEEGYSNNQSIRIISMSRENINKYVYKHLNSIYTKDVIYSATEQMSLMHRLMVQSMFWGIGMAKFTEVQLLRAENLKEIDGEYYVEITGDDARMFTIPEELYSGLLKFNDLLSEDSSRHDFIDTEYIFKPYKRAGNEYVLYVNQSIRNSLWNQFKNITNDKQFKNNTLSRSAFNYHAYREMAKNEKPTLTLEIIKKVSDRLNMYKGETGHYIGRIIDELDFDFIRDNYGKFEIHEDVQRYVTK